jgi:hypothetical protein
MFDAGDRPQIGTHARRLDNCSKVENLGRGYGNYKSRDNNDESRADAKPGGGFEVVEREIPKPGAGAVLIKVKACGVCHSDVFVKEGSFREFSIRGFPGTKSLA